MATAVLSTLHMLNIFLIAKSIYLIIFENYSLFLSWFSTCLVRRKKNPKYPTCLDLFLKSLRDFVEIFVVFLENLHFKNLVQNQTKMSMPDLWKESFQYGPVIKLPLQIYNPRLFKSWGYLNSLELKSFWHFFDRVC